MTYRQIFEQAREAGHEWADAALENCYQFGTAETEAFTDDLAANIDDAFFWSKTAQGFYFWEKVWDKVCAQLPVVL